MKCLNKIKGFLGRNKIAVAVSAVSSALSAVAVSAFAADGATGTVANSAQISGSLVSGFQTATNDLITYSVAVVPVCITAFGVTWAIKKCVSFFKGVTGK